MLQSVKLFEITAQSEGVYRAPSTPTLQVAVNGDIQTGDTIEFSRGDHIEIVSTMKYPNIGTMQTPDAPIIETADWIDTAPGEWNASTSSPPRSVHQPLR